ncbi:MAG TPA: hypothetical protein VMI55_01310 [Thermoplasmata archaeon]|nr:hypothetical protein [Thermoplasmata archaeon]
MGSASTATGGDSPVTFDSLPPRWEPTPVVPRLPVGVAVVSILIAIVAIVMVLGGVLYLLDQFGSTLVPSVLDLFPSVDLLGATILLVLGICLLAVATALWRQETWALWTTLVLVFATTVYLFFTDSITVLFILLVLLFIYLLAVRRYFY